VIFDYIILNAKYRLATPKIVEIFDVDHSVL
jgi:hypothetical protein